MKTQSAQITAQINSIKTLKDGGYRLTLDFGQDSLDAVQKLITWNNSGEANFAVVIVPYRDESKINTTEIIAG